MSRYTCHCLRCGAKKRGRKRRYKCDCGGYLIPITHNMLAVAEQFKSLGFKIAAAEDFVSIPLAEDDWRVLLVHVDFARIYDQTIFSSLPEGWDYLVFDRENISRVACMEQYAALSLITDKQAIKHIINELSRWVRKLDEDGRIHVYILAGFLD